MKIGPIITLNQLNDIFQRDFAGLVISELVDDGLFLRIGQREITIKADGEVQGRAVRPTERSYIKIPPERS